MKIIDNYAFRNCYELTFIYLYSNSVPVIKSSSFINSNSEKVFLIPQKLKVNFQSAQYWNTFSERMYCNENIYENDYVLNKIPDSENYVLSCILKTSYTTIPHIIDSKNITTIANRAINRFATTITIEEGYTKLEDYAFVSAKNIENISLPSTLNYIGNYAFYNCNNLSSLTISNSSDFIDL